MLSTGQAFSAGNAMLPAQWYPAACATPASGCWDFGALLPVAGCALRDLLSVLPHSSAGHFPGAPPDGVLPLFFFLKSKKLHPTYYVQRTQMLQGSGFKRRPVLIAAVPVPS